MRPPGFAPGTPGDREGRPYGDIRTGSVGSVNSGAELEAHRKQILQTQGPVARREIRHSRKFCAPEMAQYLSGGAPVNGVRGARLGAPERCSSEQTPAAKSPCENLQVRRAEVVAPYKKKKAALAAGAAKLSTTNEIIPSSPPHPPQCAHWGTFPPGGRLKKEMAVKLPLRLREIQLLQSL